MGMCAQEQKAIARFRINLKALKVNSNFQCVQQKSVLLHIANVNMPESSKMERARGSEQERWKRKATCTNKKIPCD